MSLEYRPNARRYAAFFMALVIAIAGCSHRNTSVAAATLPPPPTPTPEVVVPEVVSNWTMPAAVAMTRYVTEVSATLERDSAGRPLQEHVETRALISLQGKRDSTGALRANGLVDSFTVRGLERALSPSNQGERNQGDRANSTTVALIPAVPVGVSFDAVIGEHTIRVTTRPPLANECDKPETGATNIVRELLIRLPKTVSVGARWRDSTLSFQCRLGVPITSRTRAEYIVDRAEKVHDRTDLIVRKTTDTQLDGNTRSTWRTVTITGTGRATQLIRIDAATGIVQSIDGDGALTVRISDTSRRDGSGMQEVRQTTHSRTALHP